MNPKMAAALQYNLRKDSAPRLVAKGKGWMAEKIIQTAKEHNIPLKEDPHLVEILSTLDLYEAIPPDLYKAVAEILIFIYKMNNKVLQDL
ncbi:MAG: EscU/YscU/HrcU family type III secretion system export apparatus switch protein [Deltaproteobacteria bacterium]|jgi:flagellar biosynthesis protein|nr:EscU/YscU/HrcU family type III secretion system export apparatus switch protein [Deltaproteobacteria bacterium]